MSESVVGLRHQIATAQDLEAVVRTMKAMAASSIGQYENAVRSLEDYYCTVQLGLAACFQQETTPAMAVSRQQESTAKIGVVVFGSDQGLVGQFNDVMAEFVEATLFAIPGNKVVWAVGERIQSRLAETKLAPKAGFVLPNSIHTITALVGEILIAMEAHLNTGAVDRFYVFHHRPQSHSIYSPVSQQLLPLDDAWRQKMQGLKWPSNNLPEVLPNRESTLRSLVREYLFVSLFRACAESLASENASRLAAMLRAEKNIDELQQGLNRSFHRLRQSGIDEELSDVLSGFEALN